MNKKALTLLVIALLVIGSFYVLFITNFGNDDVTDDTVPSKNDDSPVIGNITSFDQAVNDFGFDLFKRINEDLDIQTNLFYSPYSVFTALAMTYEGARNNTASQMRDVLSVEQDNDTFHQYMKNLYEYLNENSEYNISTANALWPKVGFELLPEYEDIIETYYGGNTKPVDYSDPKKAADIINGWVENQTNNLIKNLVPEAAINELTRLILTNAIYFKGTWQIQFDKENTTMRDFFKSDGETIQVDTMKLTETENLFNYTDTEELKILELEYKGNDLSMLIMLPKDKSSDLSDIVNSINKDDYSKWIDQMTQKKVDIYLPKFEFETKYAFNSYLAELGMSDAFSGSKADFSGMNDEIDLFINSVLHKAFVQVNEEGTEAAAATAMIIGTTSIEPPKEPERIEFNCDHPFLFTIHHKETGTILFMGKVTEPLQEED